MKHDSKEDMSIKEFSKAKGIETSKVRFWDKIGLFSPAKRDPYTDYRYYEPEQIISINFVSVLSDLNIKLKTIGEIKNNRTPQTIAKLFQKQARATDMDLRKLREALSIIHARLELIDYGNRVDVSEVAVMEREEKAIILGPRNEWNESSSFYEPLKNFCGQADEMRINLGFPIGGYHESVESYFAHPERPDYFFSWDPTGNRKRAEGEYLIGFHRGNYGEFGDLPERLAAYKEENGLALSGPVYTLYLHDEVCVQDPSQYLAQVCIAAKKIKKG